MRRYPDCHGRTLQILEEPDPVTGEIRKRPPRIAEAEQAPRNHDEARRRWKAAQKPFRTPIAAASHSDKLNAPSHFIEHKVIDMSKV